MGQLTKTDVAERFAENLGRVRNLVKTYTSLAGKGAGRPSVEHADLLRAAVVLLHAALEDVLRSTEELCLPKAKKESFDGLNFMPSTGESREARPKFSLVDLAGYRGQTVDDVFAHAIALHLDRSNYNNIADLKSTLVRVGLSHDFLSNEKSPTAKSLRGALEAMMKRRHLIAHRADRNPMTGSGHHVAKSIGTREVENWISMVEKFGNAVIEQL